MIMCRLFRVILAEYGGLHETKTKSNVMEETTKCHDEDSIEIMEIHAQDKGGETLHQNARDDGVE